MLFCNDQLNVNVEHLTETFITFDSIDLRWECDPGVSEEETCPENIKVKVMFVTR